MHSDAGWWPVRTGLHLTDGGVSEMDQTGAPPPPISDSIPHPIHAVQYVRMSTEHQQYSTENQRDVIRQYAEKRGMDIIFTYEDAGKSGLRLDGRNALQQLIRDVETGQAKFS